MEMASRDRDTARAIPFNSVAPNPPEGASHSLIFDQTTLNGLRLIIDRFVGDSQSPLSDLEYIPFSYNGFMRGYSLYKSGGLYFLLYHNDEFSKALFQVFWPTTVSGILDAELTEWPDTRIWAKQIVLFKLSPRWELVEGRKEWKADWLGRLMQRARWSSLYGKDKGGSICDL